MPLSDLATALSAATGPDRALDERLAVEVFGWDRAAAARDAGRSLDSGYFLENTPPFYTTSLDAITAAIEERWPGAVWTINSNGSAILWPEPVALGSRSEIGYAATPALALCLAAVRLAMGER